MTKIILLPKALEDLEKINEWYKNTYSVKSAQKIRNKILDSLKVLEDFPLAGAQIPDVYSNEKEYRMIVCDNYVLLYKVIDDKVYIYHIFDSRQDYYSLF